MGPVALEDEVCEQLIWLGFSRLLLLLSFDRCKRHLLAETLDQLLFPPLGESSQAIFRLRFLNGLLNLFFLAFHCI